MYDMVYDMSVASMVMGHGTVESSRQAGSSQDRQMEKCVFMTMSILEG
jgi:predicted heme/steroid binding protein